MFECLKKKEERTNADAKGKLWYPDAEIMDFEMPTRGQYKQKYPQGAVVHFTAGRDVTDQDAINSMKYGAKEGYAFFMITPSGKVLQAHALDRWGSHAGKSTWDGLNSVSQYFVGIEVACAGKLNENNESWFGVKYDDNEVRTIPTKEDNIAPGVYRKFTNEQEASLISLLVWLKLNNPKVFSIDYILGHDEVSPGRKTDPGGSLSMTMYQLRHDIGMRTHQDLYGFSATQGD